MVGKTACHSLRVWCRSEWQTPQKRISISTSCGRGERRGMVKWESGVVADCAAKALAVKVCGLGETDFAATCPVDSVMLFISWPGFGWTVARWVDEISPNAAGRIGKAWRRALR